MYVREWNNLQYVSSAAFLLAVYSDYLSAANAKLTCPVALVQPQDLLYFAKSQADYILGKNPKSMSYLVGYGQKYPIQVHHRGASIAAISVLQSVVKCVEGFETWYRRSEGNPNVINGGLVGGPDKNDQFLDNRSNYEQTEPTISGSAPLVGLFSKLHYFNSNSGSYDKSTPAPSPTTPSTYPPKETPASPAPNTKPPASYPKETPTQAAAPAPAPYTKPGSYPQEAPAPATPTPNTKSEKCPIELVLSITSTWSIGSTTYYRHKVIIKNASEKAVRDIKLGIENLSGSLWGLSPIPQEKNTYELPQWQKVLNPGSECTFVYVQGGPQPKVSILSYH